MKVIAGMLPKEKYLKKNKPKDLHIGGFFWKHLLKLFFFILLYFPGFMFCTPHHAITYKLNGGRFGDNIVSYSKAKWLSYKYKIPLSFVPFCYSEHLAMSKLEKHIGKNFFKKINISNESELVSYLGKIKEDTLFVVAWKTQISKENIYLSTIRDQKFGAEIKKMLHPLFVEQKIKLPKNMVSVAVHVRKGGGFRWEKQLHSDQYFDTTKLLVRYRILEVKKRLEYIEEGPKHKIDVLRELDMIFPTKAPPEQYYVDQIKKLREILGNVPMYIYVFTDDQKPVELVKRFEKCLNAPNIVFETRTTKNSHNINVIEDFYAMSQFDCLIGSSSHFSWAAQLLGNHKIVIKPNHTRWITSKRLLIDMVNIFFR
jgi:hypothetical protein